MTEYTKDELKEFESLVRDTGSRDQVTRIVARLTMRKFVDKHTKHKCDAMFAPLVKAKPKMYGANK